MYLDSYVARLIAHRRADADELLTVIRSATRATTKWSRSYPRNCRSGGHRFVSLTVPNGAQRTHAVHQFLVEYAKLTDRVLGPGVKLGGYHLQLIGVSPAHQRKGVASALMEYAEKKVG